MKTDHFRWQRIGVLSAFEYPQHAGLSQDGKHCLLVEYDSIEYLIWNIQTNSVIWRGNSPKLKDWLKDGFIEVTEGEASGKYRIFGLEENYPLLTNSELQVRLELDIPNDTLNLIDIISERIIQQLEYEETTDTWAFASFSDDGSVIAVLVTHDVTFFSYK